MASQRLRLSEKTLNRYKDALAVSHRKWETEAQKTVEQMQRYLRGEHWAVGKGVPGVPKVTANMIFADIKVMLPVLALRNPKIYCKPTKATVRIPMPGPDGQPQMVPAQMFTVQGRQVPVPVLAAAQAQEALINYRWRQLRINKTVRRCLVDALTAPFAVCKLGYTVETEKVAPPDPMTLLDDPTQQPEVLEVNDLIKSNTPYAVRWSPSSFRVDPEATYPDLSDAGWIAFGWKARLDDIKKSSRFKNTRDLQATVEIKTEYTDVGGPAAQRVVTDDPDAYMRVQLWEIWDKREGKLLVIADDHDKALQFDDWPLVTDGFPAETLYFTEHPDRLYGPPDLAHIIGQQDAYNQISSMQLNHVYRFARKMLAQRGSLTDNEIAKYISAQDGEVIETDGDPRAVIAPVPDAPIPMDWWQMRGNVREDHDRISGIADFIRGVAEKVDTATEASFIQSNLNVRTNDARGIVEDFAERISRQILHIDAQTIDIPSVIPVVGPDGALALDQMLHIKTRETLLADMDIEVQVGSMQPLSESRMNQEMSTIYQAMRNDPLIDQFALRQEFMKRFKETLPDGERLLIPKTMFQQVQQFLQAQAQAQAQGGPNAPPAAPPHPGPMPQPPTPPAGPGGVPTAEQAQAEPTGGA